MEARIRMEDGAKTRGSQRIRCRGFTASWTRFVSGVDRVVYPRAGYLQHSRHP